MAKAGRRARARALAMARAAAQRRQQEQDAAEAAHGNSTIEKLPADILGVLFGCLGFHSSLAASHASKTLHKAPDAAMRARHRLTLAAMSDSSHDSDSEDEEGSVEGIDWEWMDLPFGFERVKFVFNRAEARHRRRAARRQAEADARVEDAWAERVYGPGASDDMVSV